MNFSKHCATVVLSLMSGAALAESGDADASRFVKRQDQGEILSAFYGGDGVFGQGSNALVCPGALGNDGIPVVFSEELAFLPIPEDFRVTNENGVERPVVCLTFDPADDSGERRTVLLAGEFGDVSDQPRTVEIVGDISSINFRTNFRGASADIVPLEDGPSMVFAQIVPRRQWDLDVPATPIPFGGGSPCPEDGLAQIVRVTWNGGIVRPDRTEVGDQELAQYAVTLRRLNGETVIVTPFAFGDLNDGDNIHELCLSERGRPLAVSFPAGFVVDPNNDLNPATSVVVTAGDKEQREH